jgi:hypothetical protein
MGPISESTAKKLSKYYPQGVLTADEVAGAVLCDMVTSDRPDGEILSAADGLPAEVRSALLGLLRDVRGAGFRWMPLRLGASASAPDSLDPAGLRRVCGLLENTHPDRRVERDRAK